MDDAEDIARLKEWGRKRMAMLGLRGGRRSRLRQAIRRWLGIPSEAEIRAAVLREIDADTVWRSPEPGETFASQRRNHEIERISAVAFGRREDTRV